MSGYANTVQRSRPVMSPADHYRRRAQRRRDKVSCAAGAVPTVEQIAHPENLIQVFHDLKQHGGHAPGPDDLTCIDLGPSEVADCMRGLSRVILAGTYRPSLRRLVAIPKAGGKGHRTLAIRNIADRVVAAALHRSLTPFWDRLFLPGSMGFRPELGVWDMLAQLAQTMRQQDRWVLATDDIQDAFDHVALDALMDDHRKHIQDTKLLRLIEVVLRGSNYPDRKEGIEQGSAYSPTALNVRLHYAHDLGCSQDATNPPWYRYADNLVYVCQSVPEGLQALLRSSELLQASGFTLKGEDGPPIDLRQGQESHLLGFVLSYRNGLVYSLGGDAWKGLERDLERAHEAENPPAVALQAVRGWVNAYGPAFESTRTSPVERVFQTGASYGFRELVSHRELEEWCRSAWLRWERRKASRR